MRNFLLYRVVDQTGISGEGIVAEGVEFPDKKCVLWWGSRKHSICVYDDMEEIEAIHGHMGKTKIVWRDYKDIVENVKVAIDNFENRLSYLEDGVEIK